MSAARTAKRFVRKAIAATGYEFQIYRRPKTGAPKYELDFTPQAVFDYFGYWDTKHIINGKTYGGTAGDYTDIENSGVLSDPRMRERVDFTGKSVLELGPLEAGNTRLLKEEFGAARVLAIEGKVENFLKCCAIGQLCQLADTEFRLGDLRDATVETVGKFDIVLATGVLYHLDNPNVAVEHMAEIADTIVVSTHVVNESVPVVDPATLETPRGTYRGRWAVEGFTDNLGAGLQTRSFVPFAEDMRRLIADYGFPRQDEIGVTKKANGQWSIRMVARRRPGGP